MGWGSVGIIGPIAAGISIFNLGSRSDIKAVWNVSRIYNPYRISNQAAQFTTQSTVLNNLLVTTYLYTTPWFLEHRQYFFKHRGIILSLPDCINQPFFRFSNLNFAIFSP